MAEYSYVVRSFFDRVELDPNTGCWNWIGSLDRDGYSIFNYNNGYVKGHSGYKFSYDIFVEKRPDNLLIDHLCRNRKCVNFTHLSAVTARVNTLNGNSIQAKNARKTHCINGHEYTFESTYRMNSGGRTCRICQREYMRIWRRLPARMKVKE